MKRNLEKAKNNIWYVKDGVIIEGAHERITGDTSNIRGDATHIWGNVSGISGNVSGIRGNVSGISGDVTGICGDLDSCELSKDDRVNGVNIAELINA